MIPSDAACPFLTMSNSMPFSFPRRKLACGLVVPFVPCPHVTPDEGWMERRQAHSFFRSRLRRATTLSRFDRDPSRRSTVAVFGCGPTKPAPGSGTGAAATARATPTRLGGRGPDLPRCGSRRSAGRHSPLRLQDRLRRRPLMSEDGNQYNSTSFRSQHLNSNRSHNLTLCMDQTSASTPRPDRRHPC